MTGHTQTQTPHTGDKPRLFSICVLTFGWQWCYKTKDLKKSLRKLLDNHRDDLLKVWVRGEGSWIMIDADKLEDFIAGKEIPAITHLGHPFFNGVQAYGYITITIDEI